MQAMCDSSFLPRAAADRRPMQPRSTWAGRHVWQRADRKIRRRRRRKKTSQEKETEIAFEAIDLQKQKKNKKKSEAETGESHQG